MASGINTQDRFFADNLPKKKVSVVIQTVRERVTGQIHVLPNRRILDEISHAGSYIAVTDARIESEGHSQEVDFLAVNVNQIIWIFEVRELNT